MKVRDGYCTREVKITTTIAEEVFNIEISLLRSKLSTELRKKLVNCYVWGIAVYGSEALALRKLDRQYLESFEM